MIEESKSLKKLVNRIDELLIVLNRVAEDLKQVSKSLKSITISQIDQTFPSRNIETKTIDFERKKSIEGIKMMFPEDLKKLLSFEEKEDYIIIKPLQFLGSENFAKIASVVRDIDGDYVSAGKASHFRIPRKRT